MTAWELRCFSYSAMLLRVSACQLLFPGRSCTPCARKVTTHALDIFKLVSNYSLTNGTAADTIERTAAGCRARGVPGAWRVRLHEGDRTPRRRFGSGPVQALLDQGAAFHRGHGAAGARH